MHDVRNEWPVDGQAWLVGRIWHDEILRDAFVRPEEGSNQGASQGHSRGEEEGIAPQPTQHPWNTQRVAMWLRYIVEFKELLLLMMHFTGGGPARAPEILSVRYRNTDAGGIRNILLEHGMMVFVTQYHKGYTMSGQPKVVYRYLPREVGELLVWYLWLVLPLQQEFEVTVKGIGESQRLEPFLWPKRGDVDGRSWSEDRVKRAMVRETGESMGVELNIADYRQCAAAMTDKYLGKQDGFERDAEDEVDEDEEEENRWWSTRDEPVQLQLGHSSHEAGVGYARGLEESGITTVAMRMRWREVSEKWHRHLRFPSAMGSAGRWGQTGTIAEREWQEEERRVTLRRWKAMKNINVHFEMQRMLGPEAQFRGVQEVTLQAIINGKARILSIMGTGSGKSLTFMLPARFEKAGTTIVVVPMTSLRADMKRRCDEARIDCAEWDSRRPPDRASIVLVTPESVATKGFHSFMNRLRGMYRLERIVIDECHTILDSSDDFRPKLLALRELMTIGCQVVMLTATLPPSEEDEFRKRIGIEGFETAKFRAKTIRQNIAYEVKEYDGSEEAAVAEIQAQEEQLARLGGKMIVYARSRAGVEKLAEMIGYPAFHAKMQDREKRRILTTFSGEGVQVVVATNALGMGIDIPDIRVVVHVDAPNSLRYYGQESGRAGRDGKKSRSIILKRKKAGGPEEEISIWQRAGMRLPGRAQMQAFIDGEGCRRIALDEYLDGSTDRIGCGEDEAACDICEEKKRVEVELTAGDEELESVNMAFDEDVWATQRLREQSQARVSEAARFEGRLRKIVEEWNGRCAVCKVAGKAEASLRHPTHDCRHDQDGGVKREITQMRRRFRSGDFAGCRSCGLPQAICERWTSTTRGFEEVRGARCQARWVLIDSVVALMHAGPNAPGTELLLQQIDSEGFDTQRRESVYEWFGLRTVIGHSETNRLCLGLIGLVESFSEQPEAYR